MSCNKIYNEFTNFMEESLIDDSKKLEKTKSIEKPDDHITQIKKLSDLRDGGILTDEEFESKKKDLLDRI